MGQKVRSFKGLKKGQKFIVTKHSGGHNYPLNVVLTLKRDYNGATTSGSDIAEEVQYGNTIAISCIELVSLTIEEMEKQLQQLEKEYQKESKELTDKIKFCKDSGLESYDENTFKVYQTLSVLKGKKSDIEKAKVIAELINK